jgi:hypothetical protein
LASYFSKIAPYTPTLKSARYKKLTSKPFQCPHKSTIQFASHEKVTNIIKDLLIKKVTINSSIIILIPLHQIDRNHVILALTLPQATSKYVLTSLVTAG